MVMQLRGLRADGPVSLWRSGRMGWGDLAMALGALALALMLALAPRP